VQKLRSKPLQIKRAPAEGGTFTGLASTWTRDRGGDMFAPGAFTATLAAWAARGTNIPLLLNHDQDTAIGSITSATETAEGLLVTAQLAIDTDAGAEAYALLKAGALSMSVGFTILPDNELFSGDGTRVITQADLYEISLVALAMNPDAIVHSVKRYASRAELEAAARSKLDLSARQAKKLAAVAWPVLAGADDSSDDAELGAAAERIERLLSQF
jgi:hypothetical protein